MKKEGRGSLYAAIATLTGTAIGAGFLGIPYVISKSGFIIGLIHLVVLALIVMLINLYLGEVILRTKETHQLPGYAKKYLGNKGKIFMLLLTIFGIYSALIAYFIGEGQTISMLLFNSNIYSIPISFLFFALVSSLVFFGIGVLKKGEILLMSLVITMIIILAIIFLPKINTSNLATVSSNPIEWFLPYGLILFSFLSFSAIAEVKQEIKSNGKILKKAIIIGALIPLAIYLLFTLIVVGFAGKNVPEISTFALGKFPSILAVLTMFTACFALSNAIKDVYRLDLKLKSLTSWLLAMFVPFILFFLIVAYNLTSFIKILEYSGAITGGLTGILIMFMLLRAKKQGKRKPEYKTLINKVILILLSILFIAGIIYQFVF